MSENLTPEVTEGDAVDAPPTAPPPPRRGPGHRGQDIRDTMAEMAAKAHEISLEAGSKMASAMRDVVGAAAGISAFAIESARDLVNYMVRRGQMSQEEATKLLRDVEEAHAKRPKIDFPKKPEVKPDAKPAKSDHRSSPIRMKEPAAPEKPASKAASSDKAAAASKAGAASKTASPGKAVAAKPPAKVASKAPAAKAPATKVVAKPAAKKTAKK